MVADRVRYHSRPPQFDSVLPSSGLSRVVRWCETDVSGLPIGSSFKGQYAREGTGFDSLNVEDGLGSSETSVFS